MLGRTPARLEPGPPRGRGDRRAPLGQAMRAERLAHRGLPRPAPRRLDRVAGDDLPRRARAPAARRGEIVSVSRDITERKAPSNSSPTGALHDALTGLPNRALLRDRLTTRCAARPARRAARGAVPRPRPLQAGQRHPRPRRRRPAARRASPTRLRAAVRAGDTVARLGGDEFAVLLRGRRRRAPTPRRRRAHRCGAAPSPFDVDGDEVFARRQHRHRALPRDGYSAPRTLLRDADTAMYRAKAAARPHRRVFDAAMHADAARAPGARGRPPPRHRRATSSRCTTSRSSTCADGAIVGVEALRPLARTPSAAWCPPTTFIPLAEETRAHRPPIGAGCCARPAARPRAWRRRRARPAASRSTSRPPAATAATSSTQVRAALDATTALDPAASTLEITESALMDDRDAPRRMLRALRDARRPPRHRRLRHRLLVAGLPQPLPGRRAQDRPLVRRRPRPTTATATPSCARSSTLARASACARWPRASRRRSSAGPPARPGLRRRPGLPLRSSDARRRPDTPARRVELSAPPRVAAAARG